MKKKLLSGIFALALLGTAGWGVSESMKSEMNLSDLALGSVEALARNEDGGITCSSSCLYTGVCWESYYNEEFDKNYCRFSGAQSDTCICG